MDEILEKLERVTPALMQQAQEALCYNYVVAMVVCAVLMAIGALFVAKAVRVYKAESCSDIMDLPEAVWLTAVILGAPGVIAAAVFVASVVGLVELMLWPDVTALRYLLAK